MERKLGRSGMSVSALGMGCWPIGGYFTFCGKTDGYSGARDLDAYKAVNRALDCGCTFFDTADVYGAGHSEEILGNALKGKRRGVVLQTKFGYEFDAGTKNAPGGWDVSPGYIRKACEASLKRLQTDYIDVYMCHVYELGEKEMMPMIDTLNALRTEGKIRSYGWSTGCIDHARVFAKNSDATDFEMGYNLFKNGPEEKEMLQICESSDMACVAHSSLAMGLLCGKFNASSKFGPDDVRGSGYDWCVYFDKGRPKKEYLEKLDAIQQVLTSGGRTLAQGAIAWIWAQSGSIVPIAGVKNERQAEENFGAMKFGPLTQSQCRQIADILGNSQYQ